MSEDFLVLLLQIHSSLKYLSNFCLLVSFFLGCYFYKNAPSKINKTLLVYIISIFLLWLTSYIIMLDASEEGITQIRYFDGIHDAINLLIIGYLLLVGFMQSKNTIIVFSVLIFLNVLLIIYEAISKGSKTLVEYNSYSSIAFNILVLMMCISYLFQSLRSIKLISINHLKLVFIFLSYFTIEFIFSSCIHFFVNMIHDSDYVFLAIMSKVVFDLAFSVALLIYVINEFVLIKNKLKLIDS